MEAESGTVRGERATALVSSLRSLQARASSMLAAGLMIALGLGALSWYYAHAFTRQTRAHASAQASAASRAQGEMPLPALGPIGVMTAAAPAPGPPLVPPPELPLTEAPPQGLPGTAGAAAVPAPRTAGELALQRRLEGAVFAREVTTAAPMMTAGAATPAPVHDGSEPTATPLAGWLTRRWPRPCRHSAWPMPACYCPRAPLSIARSRLRSTRRCLGSRPASPPRTPSVPMARWCCSSAAPSCSARRAAPCSRVRRASSCCGRRRVHRPGSLCRWIRPGLTNSGGRE